MKSVNLRIEVRVQTIHSGVGGVNESDVSLASAAGAIIIAFHVIAEDRAQIQADRQGRDPGAITSSMR